MGGAWTGWSHLLKVDPDKSLPGEVSYGDLAATGTDAIVVGGTTGVTAEKTRRVIEACADLGVAVYQEPSNPEAVVLDGPVDGYLVPVVLNAGDVFWVTGAHKDWLAGGGHIDWTITTTEAYVVLNPDSSVAAYTDADCDLEPDEVAAYATVAEQLLGQEIVYVEYSGRLGDPAMVAAAADALEAATLFYGGGIRNYDGARAMAAHADVIVVGDLLHDEGIAAVAETVRGARDAG
ncbi:MAG: phosphoglycerol geranylgeranyltransferase [Halobacteriales archaeon]